MTLYINGRYLTRPMTGVERYAYRMCKALAARGQRFVLVCPHAEIQSCYDVSDFDIVFWGRGQSHFWEQLVLPVFFIGKRDYLVVNFTGLGSVLIRRKVMTVHDLSFLENPKWFSKAYYLWYKMMTPLAIRTSRHIITVSEFSKREMMRFYPFVKEQKVSVVYGAVDEHSFYPQTDASVPREPYALAVSSLDPRKNFERLVEAFEGISDCRLLIVGGSNRVFTGQGGTGHAHPNIQFLGRVSDADLLRLYNEAACFIFPSVYEGFGLPPVEAMCCGCPVLVADIPVLREVCGDAALYFNPFSKEDIRSTITDYLQRMSTLKEKMRRKGFDRVRLFSWDSSADKLLRVLEQ